MRVGIVAASSVVPHLEFEAGLAHLRANGFEPVVHGQVREQAFIFPGTDDERAAAFYDYAADPTLPVIWMARGGYGAGRILPLLEKLTQQRGIPARKLLVGYSDVTMLHEFVRARWGWSTLHAPMPAASNFTQLDPAEWRAIVDYVNHRSAKAPWADAALNWITQALASPVRGELIGGNLSLWAALVGTPWFQPAGGKILFLEDIDEPFYRIDRMIVQIEQAGGLDGALAVVLGDFTNCNDENNTCLARSGSDERKPLRPVFEKPAAIAQIFGDIGRRTGVPIAQGLPVGHGPSYAPLPLGAIYELTPAGKLSLSHWKWLA